LRDPQLPQPVTYADGITPVRPGDRVSVRLFLRRRAGEVIYVPGISRRRGTYEHSGLTWVGISLPDRWAIGEIVLPETRRLKPGVRFLGRGGESSAAAEALDRIGRQEEREESEAQAAESPIASTATPRPIDWLAGIVAVGLQLGMYLIVIGLIVGAILLLRKLL
jgi:hypothetical protein